VSDPIELPNAWLERANLRLEQGLASCRSVLVNYRALLRGEHVSANDDTPQSQDRSRRPSA